MFVVLVFQLFYNYNNLKKNGEIFCLERKKKETRNFC